MKCRAVEPMQSNQSLVSGSAMSGEPGKDPAPGEEAASQGQEGRRRGKPKASAGSKGEGGKGGGKGSSGKGGGSKGGKGGKGGGSGKGSKGGKGSDWDAAQQRNLDRPQLTLEDLPRVRPQRVVDPFPQLTVCSDWPEAGKPVPRSGSATCLHLDGEAVSPSCRLLETRLAKAFYLPLIWTALLPPPGASAAEIESSPAMAQLQSLGDDRHFHNGMVRRASLADVHQGQVFWRQVPNSVAADRCKATQPQHGPVQVALRCSLAGMNGCSACV